MRPGSRAGFGGGGGGGMRPGTGQRLGSARLGSARNSMSRMGTGSAGIAVINTDVQVADRPVTSAKHGLGGVGARLGTAGQGRQIQDSTFFTSLLSRKIKELTDEIKSLRKEIEKLEKNTNTYQMLERKYEDLIKDVRNLEGQLADYNLAMDKARTSTDPEEILHFNESIRQKNERGKEEIDKVFLRRQGREEELEQVESQIEEARADMEERLRRLSPDALSEYHELLAEQREHLHTVTSYQAELENLNHQIDQAEGELRQDRYRDECNQLEKHLQRLREQTDDLHRELQTLQQNPADARVKLMEKIEKDKTNLTQIQKEIEKYHALVDEKRSMAEELSAEIQERKNSDGKDSAKYETLFQREKEISAFLDSYDERETQEKKTQHELRNNIVIILESISEGLGRKDNLPSAKAVEDMRSDLSFKEKQAISGQQTKQRLEVELRKRREELEKIKTLDEKVAVETQSLTDKMRSMSTELLQYQDIQGLKRNAEETKEYLSLMKKELSRRRDLMRGQVKQLSGKAERLRGQLFTSEGGKALQTQENRLQHQEQTIFALREYIETKGKATQYEQLKEECMTVVDEINALVIREQGNIKAGTALAAGASPY